MKKLDSVYLKTIQVLLTLLVIAFPLANSDLFSIFHPKLYPSRIVLAVIVGISVLYWVRQFWGFGEFLRLKGDYLLVLLSFLFLINAISIKNSLNLSASLSSLAYFASVIVLYVILKHLDSAKPKFLFTLYKVHLGMVSLVSIYAVAQLFLLFLGKKLPGVLYGSSFLRIPGTFYDANHLPPYILTALPFVLVLAWNEKNSYKKSGLWILAGIQAFALIITFSRSGFLGLAVAAFALTLFLIKFKMWRKVGLFAAALATFLFFAYLSTRTNYSFFERALSVFNPGEKSTSSHGLLYAGAVDLFLKHPILGVGYGSFSEQFRASRWGIEHGYIDPAIHVRVPAHSLWFEALAETGLLGLIPFLILMALFLHLPNKAFKIIRSRQYRLYFAGLISGVAGVLTGSIFYSYHLEFFWFFLFFVVLFSRRILAHQEKEAFIAEEFVPEQIPWKEIIPLAAVAVWGGVFVFWKIWSGRLVTETEGIYAWISKYILRAGFRDWERWWVPFYRESFWFEKPPLYFWLSTAGMFLYYITTFSARFWAAIMGLGTVVTTYILGRLMFGRYKGILAALLVIFWPLFVLYSHRGELITSHLFLVNLIIIFFWLARRYRICWLILGVVQGLYFLLDARAALASLFILFSLYLVDFILSGFSLANSPAEALAKVGSSTSEVKSTTPATLSRMRGGRANTSEVFFDKRKKRQKWGLLLFLMGFVPFILSWPAAMIRLFPNEVFLNPYIQSMRFLPLELNWWQIVLAVFAAGLLFLSLRRHSSLADSSTIRGVYSATSPACQRLSVAMAGREVFPWLAQNDSKTTISFLSLWLFLSCFASSMISNNLLVLVPLCLLISHFVTDFMPRTRFLKYVSIAAVGLSTILLFSLMSYRILSPSPYSEVLDMLDFRYRQDPDGNNPSFLIGGYTPIVEYYSDTPVVWFSSYDDLYKNLVVEPSEESKELRHRAYYLVDGYWFKSVASAVRSNNVGLRVLRAQGTMLLVEKF